MNTILSSYSASISELKRNPNLILKEAAGEAVAILNHNKPTAYLIPADTYEQLLDRIENSELLEIATSREKEKPQAIEVSLNEL